MYLSLQGRLITPSRHDTPFLGLDAGTWPIAGGSSPLRERAVLTSLTASLGLYDNYLSLRTLLKDDRMRRLIANPARGYGPTE
jgi:hypothetical protein